MDTLIQRLHALAEEANYEGLPNTAETILLRSVSIQPETAGAAAADFDAHMQTSRRREKQCGENTRAARVYELRARFFRRAAELCRGETASADDALAGDL